MKIVIEIPEERLNSIKHFGIKQNEVYMLEKALINGTPLPEHHGRLIDISEYEKYLNTAITYDDGNHNHVVYTNMIPTIIEGSGSG